MRVELSSSSIDVSFEAEHLRRVLINLLDNARRFATNRPDAIQVSVALSPDGQGTLGVWSDGQPLEQSVERHLFEPFFSSDSRSSGLGLYICRELCDGQGATLNYQRSTRNMAGRAVQGNEFSIAFRATSPGNVASPAMGRDGVLF
jgi:two-component system sensor histidine kinase PilS (NtrC family)